MFSSEEITHYSRHFYKQNHRGSRVSLIPLTAVAIPYVYGWMHSLPTGRIYEFTRKKIEPHFSDGGDCRLYRAFYLFFIRQSATTLVIPKCPAISPKNRPSILINHPRSTWKKRGPHEVIFFYISTNT